MGRFIAGCDRRRQLFLPDCVDDYVAEDSPVRIVDVFVDELDLTALGFADAAATGRPGYHPAMLLKLYIYGYLNQVQSSRRLDASIQRYLGMLDTADRQDGEAVELRTTRLTTRLDELRRQMRELEAMEQMVAASPDRQISLTDPGARAGTNRLRFTLHNVASTSAGYV